MKKWLLVLFASSFTLIVTAQTTYPNVAPIFYSRCTSCHNQYGHVNLTKYGLVVSEALSIQTYLNQGLMPPWPPDTLYTRFMHERFITASEKSKILAWIAKGTPGGDTDLAPTPPNYSRFKLGGTPDLVLKIPTFTSNARTHDAFDCFSLPTGLTQDRYIYAYEIIAGTPSIVHHIVAHIDTTGTFASDLSGNCYSVYSEPPMGGYAPGTEPCIFPTSAPLKMGIRVKAGSNIVLQIHYPAGTAGQVDSSEIRLYFYPIGTTGIREVHTAGLLKNGAMTIPADSVKSYTVRYVVNKPMSVFAVFPHSHKVDTSIQIWAQGAKDTIPIIRINNWDFNWQVFYTYHHLVKITPGHILYAKHVFNNTTRNPNNPFSPPQTIINGSTTTDEMIFDSFQWLDYQPGDESINLDSLLGNEFIQSVIPVVDNNEKHISVYPNPSNAVFTVKSESGPLGLITVYNLLGQQVFQEKTSTSTREINLSTIPSGIYFINAKNEALRIIKQ